MVEFIPFWSPPGFRPMSEKAIESMCNGDATPDVMALRADTLIIQVDDDKVDLVK